MGPPSPDANAADREAELRLQGRIYRIGCIVNLVFFAVLVLMMMAWGMPFFTSDREPAADEAAIRRVLDEQVAAWNRGDLDAFMAGYWNDEKLTFTSGDKLTRGWTATRDRYQQRYFTPDAAGKLADRGELAFGELEVERLSPNAAVVRGRYFLKVAGKTDTGRFTLTFRKFADGWKIVADHTSVDCPAEKKEIPKGEQPKNLTKAEVAPPPRLETLADKRTRAHRECKALAAAIDAYIAHPKNPKHEPPNGLEALLKFPTPDRSLLQENDLTDPWNHHYQVVRESYGGKGKVIYLCFTIAPDGTPISQYGIGEPKY
jgi:beta-aspartyl-peptidase (threonine type)